jgi:hypothetical protein
MSFHSSSAFLVLSAAMLVAACGDSGSGGSSQGGNDAGGSTAANNQGGAPTNGGQGGAGPSACETAQMEQNAKYAECGVDIGTPGTGGGGGGPAQAECTASLGAVATCYKDCVLAASCGALDGSDQEAAAAFGGCTTDC